ncbi:thiamine pyrophosphate-dependent enzyme [Synechococcus sp. RC10A2]|uniref:alpha-ketoacid dehydrogenase subunit alpha/beta n=1 Tax=Synechococcus sp. RC10A2 TaxID=2964529 RepID=UPI0039C5FA5F
MTPTTMERASFPKLELLRTMMLSREGDRREGILMRQGKGWFQVPGMGHEALAAIAYHLRPDDYIFPTYRDRALMLARGMTTREIALDFMARAGSSSDGRNMPAHYSSRALNVFSVATPTGSQCLPAVGAAWGVKLAGDDRVVVCSIGDAATRQGEFYEAVCYAIQENLPIVFVVEDNQYGISTPTQNMLPMRLHVFDERWVVFVNGRYANEVYEKSGEAIRKARTGGGPTILWCEIDRLSSHTSADDHRVYRPTEEIEAMFERDPIRLFAEQLIAEGALTQEQYEQMQAEIVREVDAIYQEVERIPLPDPARVLDHLFGEPPAQYKPLPLEVEREPTTMVAAFNRVLHAALETFDNIVMFGEDIEDPKGGVFGFTKGLSTKYPERVRNSPLAEATIVGTAVGLAATGYRPVFEIQFIDFITPGFHQLVSQIATLRWRSKGEWKCPLVIYSPYGAYLPAGGMWHSQSNDGWWAHTPGIRVAIPSTPEDIVGLFWAAIQDDDPTLLLIPKHIFRVRMPVQAYRAIPFGKAAVRREGTDVTVVAWGNTLELAFQAAEQFAQQGVSLEIIDPRTLVPFDWETVEGSLAKTGRLVVIHEDNRTCGFGQAIITEMTSVPERFNLLLSPPQLVARYDVHIPFCPELEYAVLPDLARVMQAIQTTLE